MRNRLTLFVKTPGCGGQRVPKLKGYKEIIRHEMHHSDIQRNWRKAYMNYVSHLFVFALILCIFKSSFHFIFLSLPFCIFKIFHLYLNN